MREICHMLFVTKGVKNVKGLRAEDWFAAGMSLALLALAAVLIGLGWV